VMPRRMERGEGAQPAFGKPDILSPLSRAQRGIRRSRASHPPRANGRPAPHAQLDRLANIVERFVYPSTGRLDSRSGSFAFAVLVNRARGTR
jgi:hypothetical protein